MSANLISVKWFGELEFWAALVKVVALATFLAIGAVIIVGRFHIQGQATGLSLVSSGGGWFPTGSLPLITATTGTVFAYGAVELLGTTAGETENPAKTMPRAINSVIARIAVFYIGSLLLLGLLLPYTDYKASNSPFVTFSHNSGSTAPGP